MAIQEYIYSSLVTLDPRNYSPNPIVSSHRYPIDTVLVNDTTNLYNRYKQTINHNITLLSINNLDAYHILLDYTFDTSLVNLSFSVFDIIDLSINLQYFDSNGQNYTVTYDSINEFINDGGIIYYYDINKSLNSSNFVDISDTKVIPTGGQYKLVLKCSSFDYIYDISTSSAISVYATEYIFNTTFPVPFQIPANCGSINDLYVDGNIVLEDSNGSCPSDMYTDTIDSSVIDIYVAESLEEAYRGEGVKLDDFWNSHLETYYYAGKIVYFTCVAQDLTDAVYSRILGEYSGQLILNIDLTITLDYAEQENIVPNDVPIPSIEQNLIKIGSSSLYNLISPHGLTMPAGIIYTNQRDQSEYPNPCEIKIGAVYAGSELIYGIDPTNWVTNTESLSDGNLVAGTGPLERSYIVNGYVLSFTVDGDYICDASASEYNFGSGQTVIYYTYDNVTSDDAANCTLTYTMIPVINTSTPTSYTEVCSIRSTTKAINIPNPATGSLIQVYTGSTTVDIGLGAYNITIYGTYYSGGTVYNPSVSYNESTGILTVSGQITGRRASFSISVIYWKNV